MIFGLSFLLFLGTLIGGSIPFWMKSWNQHSIKYLLAFSGSFLLGITLLHLIPEGIFHFGSTGGVLIVIGFFLQLIFQRLTHGIEHGHVHLPNDHKHSIALTPLYLGLSLHAFSEGIPLGMQFFNNEILISIFGAISFHKIPEIMLIAAVIASQKYSKFKTWSLLVIFCLITPISALLTHYLGQNNEHIKSIINYCMPVIAGSFLHIATTIFYESGTKKHEMNFKNWIAIILGITIAFISMISGGHQH